MCRSRSIKAIDVFVGVLDFFWTRETVRESLGLEGLYFFLYAFILFVVNRNAIFDIFNFLLKQVCMCEQWLALDLMSSLSNPLGVL
jgi:hypothetical protein